MPRRLPTSGAGARARYSDVRLRQRANAQRRRAVASRAGARQGRILRRCVDVSWLPSSVIGLLAGAGLVAVPAQAASAATGCALNSGTIPAGATRASIPDVDGDGVRDTEYYTEYLPHGGYDYGIETASGHLARIHETMPGPGDHGGWTARLAHSTVVTVIDDGRSARLYSFRGCGFHAVKNRQGRQYTFSIAGHTGPSTGVACVAHTGGPRLYGERAPRRHDDTWNVQRTRVLVSRSGASARNGASTTVGTKLAFTNPKVHTAFGSSCGTVTRVHNSGN